MLDEPVKRRICEDVDGMEHFNILLYDIMRGF